MTIKSSIGTQAKEFIARRQTDIAFITRFHWKSSTHLKEAVSLLVSSKFKRDADIPERPPVLDRNEYRQIRKIIASNPNTPASVLDYLARNSALDAEVLERIAGNPQASDYTLVFLAHSKFAPVRAAIAENINATPDILTVLGSDPDVDVRYSLAENPYLPIDFLAGLTEDSNPYVRHRAVRTLMRLEGGELIEGGFVRSKTSASKPGDNVADG